MPGVFQPVEQFKGRLAIPSAAGSANVTKWKRSSLWCVLRQQHISQFITSRGSIYNSHACCTKECHKNEWQQFTPAALAMGGGSQHQQKVVVESDLLALCRGVLHTRINHQRVCNRGSRLHVGERSLFACQLLKVSIAKQRTTDHRFNRWVSPPQVLYYSYYLILSTVVCTSNASRLFVAPKLQHFQQNPFNCGNRAK